MEEVPLLAPPPAGTQTLCSKNSQIVPNGYECLDEGTEYLFTGPGREGEAKTYKLAYFAPPEQCPYLFALSIRGAIFHTARVLVSFADAPGYVGQEVSINLSGSTFGPAKWKFPYIERSHSIAITHALSWLNCRSQPLVRTCPT